MAGLDLTYDTGPRLGLGWTLLTTQDLAWNWTGPYDTGPRLGLSWTLRHRTSLEAGPYLRHRSSLGAGLDLTWGTGPRL
jgi:hypothetical protein